MRNVEYSDSMIAVGETRTLRAGREVENDERDDARRL